MSNINFQFTGAQSTPPLTEASKYAIKPRNVPSTSAPSATFDFDVGIPLPSLLPEGPPPSTPAPSSATGIATPLPPPMPIFPAQAPTGTSAYLQTVLNTKEANMIKLINQQTSTLQLSTDTVRMDATNKYKKLETIITDSFSEQARNSNRLNESLAMAFAKITLDLEHKNEAKLKQQTRAINLEARKNRRALEALENTVANLKRNQKKTNQSIKRGLQLCHSVNSVGRIAADLKRDKMKMSLKIAQVIEHQSAFEKMVAAKPTAMELQMKKNSEEIARLIELVEKQIMVKPVESITPDLVETASVTESVSSHTLTRGGETVTLIAAPDVIDRFLTNLEDDDERRGRQGKILEEIGGIVDAGRGGPGGGFCSIM